jgi:hypothetical protein
MKNARERESSARQTGNRRTQITTRDAAGLGPGRDPVRLRRFLEAYAGNSAEIAEARTIYDKGQCHRTTPGRQAP